MAIAALLALLWWLKGWQSIRKGGKALAEGNLNYVTDTEQSLGPAGPGRGFERHLQGDAEAVDQRIRSDRFRTELITNVSHDLKTPLTSIINYVDLLKSATWPTETARNYLEVLDRKSQRLKTLTEDLVEASKSFCGGTAGRAAAAGNLPAGGAGPGRVRRKAHRRPAHCGHRYPQGGGLHLGRR